MKIKLLFTGLAYVLALQAIASEPIAHEVWQRDAAMAAVNSARIDVATRAIGDISTLADAEFTLKRLTELENRADWPLPVRPLAGRFAARCSGRRNHATPAQLPRQDPGTPRRASR